MIPQGQAPINLSYFEGLQQRIEGCSSCDQLTEVVNDLYASVEANITAINAQIAALAPLLSLLEAPAVNPQAIVTWITGFITNFLTPYLKPYTIYPVQLTQISAQMAQLPPLIEAKMAQFPSCNVPIPPLPGLPT